MKPLWRDDPLADFEDTANLTETAEEVLRDATRLAADLGARRTGTAHLLLILLGNERTGENADTTSVPLIPADALATLAKAGVTRQSTLEMMTELYPATPFAGHLGMRPTGRAAGGPAPLPWTRGLRWVVIEARREAHVAGSLHAHPKDLLLAVTRPHDGTAAALILNALAEDPAWLHHRLVRTTAPSRDSVVNRTLRHLDREVQHIEEDLAPEARP
jgi:hypothetical protein